MSPADTTGTPPPAPTALHKAMDFIYSKSGASAESMAACYLNSGGTLDEKVNSLIRWEASKSAAVGFTCSFGGVVTMPLTMTTDLVASMCLNFRVICMIAIMYGFKVHDPRVQTMAYISLLGDAAGEVLRTMGVQVGNKMAANALKKVSGRVLIKINKTVGFRLITKAGRTGVVNLIKWVPVAGAIVGGAANAVSTRAAAFCAMKIFSELRASIDRDGNGSSAAWGEWEESTYSEEESEDDGSEFKDDAKIIL